MTPTLLTAEERDRLLEPLLLTNGWTKVQGRDAIKKTFMFTDFKACFAYMTLIGEQAESLNHHPEWFNVYNRLEITWSTHDCQGLSNLDIQMASFCDANYKL